MGTTAWQVLRELEAWQVTQIPRRPADRRDPSAAAQDQPDQGAAQRLQALVSAYHYGAPAAFCWLRDRSAGPVRVVAAGPALRADPQWADTHRGQVVLTIPSGARADPLPVGQAADLLARMPCWVRLAGIADALLAGPSPGGRDLVTGRPARRWRTACCRSGPARSPGWSSPSRSPPAISLSSATKYPWPSRRTAP